MTKTYGILVSLAENMPRQILLVWSHCIEYKIHPQQHVHLCNTIVYFVQTFIHSFDYDKHVVPIMANDMYFRPHGAT